MQWGQLMPFIDEVRQTGLSPQVMVIHWGENDLGSRTAVSLLLEILQDLQASHQYFLGSHLVWLPRRVWRGIHCPVRTDNAQRWISNVVGWSVIAGGGSVISYPKTKVSLLHLFTYRTDGVHLSLARTELVLADL